MSLGLKLCDHYSVYELVLSYYFFTTLNTVVSFVWFFGISVKSEDL